MDASCSKEVSSSREFNKSFTESDESVYSEISSESNSDSYHSDKFYQIIFLQIYQLHWTLRIKTMMINGFR